MPTLPKLSIAAKLYAIFALLATVAVAMAGAAVLDSRREVTLMQEFNTGFLGARYVERVNGLIYAVVMESRGIYMSPDVATAKPFAKNLLKFNDAIAAVVRDWRAVVREDDAEQFAAFAKRIDQFQEFRRELVRRGTEISPASGREYGDNDANRSVRSALNKDLDALAAIYATRSQRMYAQLADDCNFSAILMSSLGLVVVMLAVFGGLLISRAVVRPLAKITGVTEQVAAGAHDLDIPYGDRRDEIGALARSITVFEQAIRRNEDLKQTIVADGEARAKRQEAIGSEIARFGAEVEATLKELSRISAEMLAASGQLSEAADTAATRTAGATTASGEASTNVRDIASAAEELSASVNEIDRQVAQSNAIAGKAVADAEQTNAAVKELGDAAARIGDVVRLITAIAEQTNLLALNATIEAARAGEAGRGFAVVAGEVKALAGQTAKATDQIGAQITGMQQATTRSIDAIAGIARTIREIGEISAAIAAAVTQQGAATQEIARSVETAAKRTNETANEVGLVTDATTATRTSAASVKTVATDLDTVAARVRGQIDQFFARLNAA